MGRPKKIDSEVSETTVENAETVVQSQEEVVNQPKVEENVDINSLMAIVKKQSEIIESQKKALEQLIEKRKELPENENTAGDNLVMIELLQTLKNNTKRDIVKVIHLDDVAQAIYELPNGNKIKFNHYGQVQPMSIVDAELLLNKCKTMFERGLLTFDSEHLYMIEECGIDTTKMNYKPMESIKKANKMSNEELGQMVTSLQPFQREMLKTYIFNEIAKDKKYISVDKLRFLNKLHKNIYKSQQGGYEFIIEKLTELGVDE